MNVNTSRRVLVKVRGFTRGCVIPGDELEGVEEGGEVQAVYFRSLRDRYGTDPRVR